MYPCFTLHHSDIDECAQGSHMCHYNQQCVNTVGTYRCQAKCGPGFKPSITGTSCEGKSLLITVKLSAQQFIWRQNNSIPELLSTFFRPVTAVFNQDSFLSVQYTGSIVSFVCFRCGRVPRVYFLPVSASVSQYSGLLPLYLPPRVPAVRTPLHRSVT